MLGEHVNQSNLSCLWSKWANHVFYGVLPPGDIELNFIPLAIWLHSWQVKISTPRAVDLCSFCDRVNMCTRLTIIYYSISSSTYISCSGVKPVCDVGSCGENYRVAQLACVVVLKKTSQVKDLSEERHPAIILCVVQGNLGSKIVPS